MSSPPKARNAFARSASIPPVERTPHLREGVDPGGTERSRRVTPADLARVAVVGTSCSGKTTFAQRLACTLGAPYVELDALHWGPAWTVRPDFHRDVQAAVGQPCWVIDGNYSAVRDIIWRRCTAIVWLDYSFVRVLSRALRRTAWRIVTREPLYAGNRETIRNALLSAEGIPCWVIRTHAKRRREYPALLTRSEYGQAVKIQLPTPAAAEAFLASRSERRKPGASSLSSPSPLR